MRKLRTDYLDLLFFHRAVGAVVIAERLMDEQQVEIISAQLAHGFLDG